MTSETITRDVELSLIEAAQAGDSTAEGKLLEAHTGWAVTLAGRFGRPDIEDDLAQAGLVGLLQAVRRFDLAQPVRLISFARTYMLAAMNETAADLTGHARVPRRTRDRAVNGNWDGRDETAAAALEFAVPLDEAAGYASGDGAFADVETIETARSLLGVLDIESREIVRRFFGFEGEPQSDQEIAEALGMAKTTVIRRRQAALGMMAAAAEERP
jgi:RNA polymerase sigma factor (sigma-70 family)